MVLFRLFRFYLLILCNIHVFKEEYDSEDMEDMIINPTDSVVVCARTEDDVNFLEVS